MKSPVKTLFTYLSSIKMAVAILSAIAIFSIPATLIPQGQSEGFYQSQFPGIRGTLFLILGYNNFFTSPLFLSLIFLFWINLFSCTIKRLKKQLKHQKRRRFGPDIIHIGLLLLIVFAIFSGLYRQEGVLKINRNDPIKLPSGRYLLLDEFVFETYPDGRPSRFASEVSVYGEEQDPVLNYTIEVNKPLKLDGLTLYQYSYEPSSIPGEYNPGILIVHDRFTPFIYLTLILILSGIVLTLFQRKKK